ncbi:MAG: hypothetical protein KC635_12235, partial [Myxococcales bacterium]|nr:hypothetical protein [Myxococcales bacterium]
LRLELLARVSRIRAIQGQCPVDEVERAAATAVRDLTALAKAWWPGSVSAMQLRATPLDAGAELGLPGGGRLHDWAEAADAADARLAALPAELAASGRDDDGWADARACAPAPSAPDARLAEVVAAVDKALAAKPDDPGELEALAARLRWLRPHVDDGPAWADAVGKLRRRASMRSLGTLPGLARRLASDGLPSASTWARELGEDPEAKALKQKRKALMRRSPVAGTPEEQVLTWLAAAFELGDELPNAKIADALAAHRELLLSVDSDDLPRAERVHRRRLRSLQAALRGEAVSDDEDDDDLDADVDPDDNVDDAGEAEVVRLRPHVDGKRALFLTNRASPEIESELRDRLGLDVKLSLVDQRRRQSAAKALSHGGYDLVIVAHRFVGHDVDFDLGPRAKEVGIPYVRASSGRFGSVVRALVRDLGVA